MPFASPFAIFAKAISLQVMHLLELLNHSPTCAFDLHIVAWLTCVYSQNEIATGNAAMKQPKMPSVEHQRARCQGRRKGGPKQSVRST